MPARRVPQLLRTLGLLPLALAVQPAQADEGVFAIGYGQRGDAVQGLELALGLRRQVGALAVEFLPLTGIVHSSGTRYREELQADGDRVCRDTRKDRLVPVYECGPDVSFAAVLSADYALAGGVSLGLGARLARRSDAFAMLRMQVGAQGGVQLKLGGKYLSISASTGF